MDATHRAAWIKDAARQHGFDFVGIARAEPLDPERQHLEEWLSKGYHGEMSYMERHFDLRTDPTRLVPGAKSVVSLLYNYYNPQEQTDPGAPRISMYAYGEDYHRVLRHMLKKLLRAIREEFGRISGRCFVDSGPVMERDWARRAGVGWIGKNTLLINPRAGSYFFLAELILDLELAPDAPMQDFCGTCTRCIDACPTEAIQPGGYQVDGSKCISYLTIELRAAMIPEAFKGKMENNAFGCDICQEVCPWNRFSTPHHEPAFEPSEKMMTMPADAWHGMTEETFSELFRRSAVKRTGFKGLKRNLAFLRSSRS